MAYLLDTSIVSELFQDNEKIKRRLAPIPASVGVYTSVLTEGELLYGASRVGRDRRRSLLKQISEFLDVVAGVVYIDRRVAAAYADVRRSLEIKGQIIPANDLWIAAIAIGGGMTLVAHDEHFRRVEDLSLEDWLES